MLETRTFTHREAPQITPLGKSLIKNFYLSFKFSQGYSPTQRALYEYIAHTHSSAELRASFSTFVNLYDSLAPHTRHIIPPENHKQVDQDEINDNVTNEWIAYMHLFRDHFNKYKKSRTLPTRKLLRDILDGILSRDFTYQNKIRPNKKESEDVHESFLRTYGLLGHPTASPEFDSLFRRLAQALYDPYVDKVWDDTTRTKLELLMQKWHTQHPGQSFFPPENLSTEQDEA